MPVKIQNTLPAKAKLEDENIFVMDETRAVAQDIRPLQILVLNLMPIKQDTELQLLRAMSNTPLQIDVTFLQMKTHVSKNTSESHLHKFYNIIDDVKDNNYDGFIITGAPVEQLHYTEVNYWEELEFIMDWADAHCTSILYICWGAQAGLYHHYGVPKYPLEQKVSGVFPHKLITPKSRLFHGFDSEFNAPHSRHTETRAEDILKVPELRLMALSDEAGVYAVGSLDGSRFFIMGHSEYDAETLDTEYRRDLAKGLNPQIPRHYYPDDDPKNPPVLNWRAHSSLIYTNWLNYYVYQTTPFDINQKIK